MKKLIKKLGISVVTMLIVINLIEINIYAENEALQENIVSIEAENKEESTTKNEIQSKANTEKSNSANEGTSTKTTSTKKLTEITVDGVIHKNGDKITVDNSKSSVKIYGNEVALIYIKVNGKWSTVDVNLLEGENTIVVTDANGEKVTVYVTREKKKATVETVASVNENQVEENDDNTNQIEENVVDSTDVADNSLKLSSLNIEGVQLSPSFNENTYSYTATINMNEKDYKTLNIKVTPSREDAIITIDGNEELVEGENIINIIVKSTNSDEIKTYQLVVNKVKQEIATTKNKDNNKINIAIIVVATLIAVVAIILIIKKIKNRKDSKSEEYTLYNYDLYNNPLEEKNFKKYTESKEQQEIEEIPDITYVEELPQENKKETLVRKKKYKGKHM